MTSSDDVAKLGSIQPGGLFWPGFNKVESEFTVTQYAKLNAYPQLVVVVYEHFQVTVDYLTWQNQNYNRHSKIHKKDMGVT